jgi:hypothetical protein
MKMKITILSCLLVYGAIFAPRLTETKEEVKEPSYLKINDAIKFPENSGRFTRAELLNHLSEQNRLHNLFVNSDRLGCLPSVLYSQELLESRGGKSFLTTKTKNTGNIKCNKNIYRGTVNLHNMYCKKKTLKCVSGYDKIEKKRDYYVSFSNHWEGWSRKVKILEKYPQIKKIKKEGELDPLKWLWAIHKAPYATDVNYYKKLKSIYVNYNLQTLDKIYMKSRKECLEIRTYSGKYLLFSPNSFLKKA